MEKDIKKTRLKKIGLILIIVLTAIIVLLSFSKCSSDDKESIVYEILQVDSNQTNKQVEVTTKKPSYIALPGFAELTVKANTTDVHIGDELFNPSDNIFYNCPECGTLLEEYHCPKCDMDIAQDEAETNEYYLKFEIYLDDTNEMIYSSDLVSPGYHIEDITLSRGLDVGDYNATVVIRPYRNDMISECNNGQLNITLHVTDTV